MAANETNKNLGAPNPETPTPVPNPAPENTELKADDVAKSIIEKAQEAANKILDDAIARASSIIANIPSGSVAVDDDEVLPEPAISMTKEQQDYLNERVPIKLFKDKDKYKDDVTVFVNGKPYLIQRGVQIEVPRFVAMVLESSDAQEAFASDVINGFVTDYQDKAEKIG